MLCHGLYGFDVRGPFLGLEIHYWAAVLDILRKKVGADVIVRGVPGTGAIAERAEALHAFLKSPEAGVQGRQLNFIGHSMGGLDARHLIANIRPTEYTPVSLTSISTPHRGSPFMDWCNANVGVGNETIEQAVREARAKQQGGKVDVDPETLAGNKVPYTLKTPLFVRPKKEAGNGDSAPATAAQAHQPKAHSSAERKDVDSRIEEESRGGEADKSSKESSTSSKGKSKSNGLSFGLGTFASALSSLSGSFSAYMLSVFDQPAYAMLSTKYMAAVFNPSTPDVAGVKYYSIAARTRRLAVWHPLWLPKLILDAAAESRTAGGEADGSADALGGDLQGNDGLVSVQSARWGEFLGIMDGCDHWDLRGAGAPRWGSGKVNPATGKPWAGKEAEEKEARERAGREARLAKEAQGERAAQDVKDKAEKNKQQQRSSWLEINRLLDVFAKKDDKKPKHDVPQAPAPAAIVASSTSSAQAQASAAPPAPASESSGASKEAQGASVQDQVADAAKGFLSHYAAQSSPDGSPSASPSPAAALGKAVKEALPNIKSSLEDNAIVTEVAAWISDRLPERDEERRAQAELAADRQDAVSKARRQALVDAQPRESEEEGAEKRFTFASGPTWEQAAQPTAAEYAGDAPLWEVPLAAPLASSWHTSEGSPVAASGQRLRRDAEWLAAIEATGGTEASRQLRRELAWHRSERARLAGSSGPYVAQAHAEAGASIPGLPPGAGVLGRPRGWELDWDAHAKKRPMPPSEEGKAEDERRREKERREAQSLERFWLALCLHLRNEGL